MNYLADVNVWIALAAVGHVHHSIALAWFEEPQTSQILFSRITQMGLLRLLTNRKVMGENILTPADAWRVYASLCDDDRVQYAEEPPHLEDRWRQAARHFESSPNFWTDAYLAAFALQTNATVVTLDRRFLPLGKVEIKALL